MANIENKKIKRQLHFMLAYIILIYLPFFCVLAFKFEIFNISLSRIGWRTGGMIYLILFAALTIPFMLYQVFFFTKNLMRKNKLLKTLSIISASLISATIFTPYRAKDSKFVLTLHNVFGGLGAFLTAVCVTIMVVQYCMQAINIQKIIFAVLYALYVVVMGSLLIYFSTVVFTQVGASICFLLFMFRLDRGVAGKEKYELQDAEASEYEYQQA